MQELTVGKDHLLDQLLVVHDCVGSAAHARMLHKAKLLSRSDLVALLKGLQSIYKRGQISNFPIPISLEDVHTAIESELSDTLGEAGLRIHTSRSRNDQVMLAMRLFLRSEVTAFLSTLCALLDDVADRFQKLEHTPLPGYTHLQPAMPSSMGMWLHALYEDLLEEVRRGLALLTEIDANPLGGTAGFGSSMKVDPKYVAKLLGFSRIYRNPIQANNSRGRVELRTLQWLTSIAGGLEKFFWDISLFCTREFGFFKLPNELTTGSSIMPQKRNPDIVELARGRCAKVRGAESELAWIIGKLPTSYHRDLQLTKEPVMRALDEMRALFLMTRLVIRGLQVDQKRVKECMYADLYATYDAYREVEKGAPFREAYRRTAERVKGDKIKAAALAKDFLPIAQNVHNGMRDAKRELAFARTQVGKWQRRIEEVERMIFTAPRNIRL